MDATSNFGRAAMSCDRAALPAAITRTIAIALRRTADYSIEFAVK
jgi:hypothetical protein